MQYEMPHVPNSFIIYVHHDIPATNKIDIQLTILLYEPLSTNKQNGLRLGHTYPFMDSETPKPASVSH